MTKEARNLNSAGVDFRALAFELLSDFVIRISSFRKVIALAFWVWAVGADAAGWPMFRGGQALLGVAQDNLPPKLNLLWNFKTGGPVKSSAAIDQERVFIGSGDESIYALGLADGKKI